MTGRISFELGVAAPFRLDLTVWTLRRRPQNIVDRWDGETYRRVLVTDDGEPFELAVKQVGPPAAPRLCVSVNGKNPGDEMERQAVSALKRLLGIDVSLEGFYRMAERDRRLKPLADQFRGFRPPRFQSYFETLVNAISCQQLTLTVGIHLLNSLAEAYGSALETKEGISHAFPRPQDLANVDIELLRKMGFSYQKARYLTGLAQSIVQGELNLDEIEALDDRSAVARLRELKGVGRWTAEYFLLRGLGRIHVFPADDVGARNHLGRWLGIAGKLGYDEVHQALEPWKDYGGLVYFHLLLKSLMEKEIIG